MRLLPSLAFLRQLPGEHIRWWQGLLWAFTTAGVSFLLHWAVEPFFQPDRGFIVFIPGIVLVTLIAGARYGVLTAALSGILVWYVTLPPVNAFALSHPDGVSLCVYVASSAIAIALVYGLRKSQAREQLLRRELQHRTKNLFALVHSLASQTLRGDTSIDEAREAFLSRLMALNRANETMGESEPDGVDLDLLVRSALKSFSDHFACNGAKACVGSQTARNLSLALHELATNSMKYGALSAPQGTVQVSWKLANPGGALDFVWKEQGGPTVSPPTRRGFGTRLLSGLFDNSEAEFAPDGLVYRLRMPLAG